MAPIPYDKMIELIRPDISPFPPPLIHRSCQEELDKLYPNEFQMKILGVKLKNRIQFFRDYSRNFFVSNPKFEFIQNVNDHGKNIPIYAIRFDRDRILGNLRILFVVDSGKMYLLHAFLEQGTKKYRPAMEVVKQRIA